jgi:riboflavin synthase alpha subunit
VCIGISQVNKECFCVKMSRESARRTSLELLKDKTFISSHKISEDF